MPKAKSIKSKPSFISYTDGNSDKSNQPCYTNSVFYDNELRSIPRKEPEFLPGEAVIGSGHNVLHITSFHNESSSGSGVVGVVYVTNFRLIFCKLGDEEEEVCQRNKLVKEEDIVLSCIDSVYQVSKGRKRKLLPQNGPSGNIKTIQIHCKDFQLHSFSFKQCDKDEAKKVVNALLHHSFPKRLDLLFAFDLKVDDAHEGSDAVIPRFNEASDWQTEIDRLHVKGFKVLSCNINFQNCDSLPEVMVVPSELNLSSLKDFANQFVESRWPVWSYSYKNGTALVRMSNIILKTLDPQLENKVQAMIKGTHPQCKAPEVLDFSELQQSQNLPSLKEIQSSFNKLRDLCMPSRKKDLMQTDNTWFSSLDSCGWLQIVIKCLNTAVNIVQHMVDKTDTVIVKESSGRDLSPLVTSLVQLMLDPHYRTIQGFQTLVEKEWVALGHNFTEKIGLLMESDQCPLFILFLDCVWQIHLQYPSTFQFSEVYLITLWDTVCLGLFDNFIFNCIHKRLSNSQRFRQYKSGTVNFMSAWEWSRQFDKENMALFNNPLYITRTELKSDSTTNYADLSSGEHNPSGQDKSGKFYKSGQDEEVLRPVVRAPLVKFWSHCYLRWVTPLEIIGGGSPSEYLQQCLLVEEILWLQHQLHSLTTDSQFIRSARPKSDLVFSFDVAAKSEQKESEGNPPQNAVASSLSSSARWSERVALTSSFPYRSTKASFKLSPSDPTVSLFLENSFIQDSDDDADLESIDGLDISGNNSLAVTMAT